MPFSAWPSSLWEETSLDHNFNHITSDLDCDVCIIGAGFSGLWTAIHLSSVAPEKKIVILEAAQPGFGASGRNGGWCSAFLPMSLDSIAKNSSRNSAIAMQFAMNQTISDIGLFIKNNQVNCGWVAGGTLQSATNPAHLSRLQANVSHYRQYGFGDEQISLLSAEVASRRINACNTLGATYSPHCAALHPGQLIDGLVKHCISNGVLIFGNTRVTSIESRQVFAETPDGRVRVGAAQIVRATEGYTSAIKQSHREIVPLYSYMLATEPLPDHVWESIGWEQRETFADARNMIIYAQRTADNRIAFGGRGAPYRFGSAVKSKFDQDSDVHQKIALTMHKLFPASKDAIITHRWGGPLGVARDWFTGVTFDRDSGLATMGSYVGDGVAASYLAAKTLAHLIAETSEPVTRLPWTQHVSPKWEREPFRWMGINALLKIPEIADAREMRAGRPSSLLLRFMRKFTK